MFEIGDSITYVDKSEWSVFYSKAQDLQESMNLCFSEQLYVGAVNSAINCAISACDSLLIKDFGIKSKHTDHKYVITLMRRGYGKEPKEELEGLYTLMVNKSLFQYDACLASREDAEEAIDQAERIFNFVTRKLNLA